MKRHSFAFILVFTLLMLSSIPMVEGKGKVKEGDKWQYIADGKFINETAIGKFEYVQGDVAITMIEVNTTRYIDSGQYLDWTDADLTLILDLNPVSDLMYVTQTGAFPIVTNAQLTGSLLAVLRGTTVWNYTVQYTPDWTLEGKPTNIFQTGESETMKLSWNGEGSWLINETTIPYSSYFSQQTLFSSDDDPSDPLFNVTITDLDGEYQVFGDNGDGFFYNSYSNGASTIQIYKNYTIVYDNTIVPSSFKLNQIDLSEQYSWDTDNNVPIQIRQIEPVRIGASSGLSLNQIATEQLVEYNLYQEPEEPTETTTSSSEITSISTSTSTEITTSTSTESSTNSEDTTSTGPVPFAIISTFVALFLIRRRK